ncbi:MAG: protein kinase, partial [Planctomycetota bacterium]|nr:protein kinase [Planctomycetota bacterium]
MATGPATRSPRDYFYGEVLTLPPGTKHPDHYTLLGLRFFEDDHHTILRAALDRIRLLETCQVDPRPGYQRMAERLLVEVRDAQITLLDPNKRSDYDAALIGRQERARRAESGDEEMHLAVGAMYGGRYRILREMRVGLLGVVYEAMDKNLRAKVHLSVLRPRLSRDRARRRPIEHAARRAATADHPNLLRLDEVGEADGAFFVRTRATDAKSLRLVLDSAPERMLPPEEVRRIGLQIAQALVRLHKGGGAHGRLRLDSVLVEEDGRVLVSDAFVARAVMDAIAQQHAPEASPAGDVVALGVLLYRLLTGNRYRRNGHELNLPEDIDPSFAAAMQSLLAADTAARPADGAAVVALLEPAPATVTGNVMRSKWPWIAGAAAILLGVGLSMGSSRDPAPDTAAAEARAWRSVAEGRYDEVIAELTPRREPVFAPPLARALELGAVADERAGNVWRAQRRLSDAQRIEPNARREVAYARVERAARERLDAVALPESAASREAVLRLDTKKAHLRSVRVEGEDLDLSRGVAEKRFDFPDGTHDVACELEDEAGNRRRATLRFVVDKTPPEITIEAPRPGEKFPTRDIIVRARVSDRQVLGRVTIAGREVPVRDGVASATLQLDDGDHDLVVEALDRAGNVATATRRVFVDSTAPTIALDADRLVTSSGTVTIAGRVRGRAKRLTIGGAPVPIVDDRFEQTIAVQRDRTVELVAESGSGLVQKKSVAVVVDTKPPSVTVIHSRRDAAGVLLYGAQEMDETFVSIRLRVRDKTVVTYETSNGTVVNGNKAPVWRVPARGGRHKAKLRAIDEAGLATAVAIELEGRRHTPHLAVKCPVRDQGFIRDQNVTLEIDADGPVLVQGERRSPGRHKVALNEGRVELAVVASDRYG